VVSLFGHFARCFGVVALLVVMTACGTFPSIAAPYAAIVMDARTGETLYSKNANTRLHPASLTKMMTLYIAFEEIRRGNLSLDTMITVSKNAAAQPPSKLGLRAGQKIALRYLIRAAAVKSANDAAAAIGDAIGGSQSGFAKRMNRTAKAIGMTDSTFSNANGLTESGHLSTARDMNVLGRRLFYDFPEFYNIFSRRSTDAGMAQVANTNRRFLDAYKGADGIKTGYTVAAGFNLTASAERGNTRIIATVFGGQSTAHRNAKMAELMDLGFGKAPANAKVTKPPAADYQGGDELIASAEPTFEDLPGGSAKTIRLIMAVSKSPRPKGRPDQAPAETLVAQETAVADEVAVAMQEGIAGALAEATTPPPPDTLEAQTIAIAEAPAEPEVPEAENTSVSVDVAAVAATAEGPPPKPDTLEAQSQQIAAAEPVPSEVAAELAPPELATLAATEDEPAIVVPKSAQKAPPARPIQLAVEPDVAEAVAEAVEVAVAAVAETSIPSAIEDTVAVPAVEPEVAVEGAAEPEPLQLAAAVIRPAKRNAPIFDKVAAAPEAAELEPEIITRVSTSGGRYWGVNIGRFGSSYEAERALLKTQLAESATLNDGLRKVIKKSGSFDANFMGLSQEQADLACRRLQARAVQCFTIGP
jgi:D-alanyl-D-alanine carboxypeptidase